MNAASVYVFSKGINKKTVRTSYSKNYELGTCAITLIKSSPGGVPGDAAGGDSLSRRLLGGWILGGGGRSSSRLGSGWLELIYPRGSIGEDTGSCLEGRGA